MKYSYEFSAFVARCVVATNERKLSWVRGSDDWYAATCEGLDVSVSPSQIIIEGDSQPTVNLRIVQSGELALHKTIERVS